MARVYVGTSGWNYAEWRSGFYKGIAQRNWLPHCAEHFDALEVNATFYRQMNPAVYARWRRDTPEHFRFCIKGHRYVTHVKRLKDMGGSIIRARNQAKPLGDKLACVLWQFPANFRADLDRLDSFLRDLQGWPEVRHATEFRDASWFSAEVAKRLKAANVAHVLSDAPDWPMWTDAADRVGGDFVYVRLHGHTRTYISSYATANLKKWAERVQGWLTEDRDVYFFFDNTMTDAAARNARRLMSMIGGV